MRGVPQVQIFADYFHSHRGASQSKPTRAANGSFQVGGGEGEKSERSKWNGIKNHEQSRKVETETWK